MVVGEAPGADEDTAGRPFVGRSGQELFDKVIPTCMQLPRERIFIANTLKCRPPGNRDPKPEEVYACRSFLHRQIMMVNPKVIMATGKHAARWLTEQPVNTMKEVHNQVYQYGHIPVVVMVHPAAYLRGKDQWKDMVWESCQLASKVLSLPYDDPYWVRK
jgi:DNA polymerase